MKKSFFKIIRRDSRSGARLGKWHLRRGVISTPAFMPDATRGVIRGLSVEDTLQAGVKCGVINTLHLAFAPGAEYFRQIGGIHQFMDIGIPLLSDSGGFQVMSLSSKMPDGATVSKRGFWIRSPHNNQKFLLSPEVSMNMQFALQTDAMVVLDHCMNTDDSLPEAKKKIARTTKWAARSQKAFIEHLEDYNSPREPFLFAVIQGGRRFDLRQQSYHELEQIGFAGYGFGGWPLDDKGDLDLELSQLLADTIAPEKMRYGMGIGTPADIVNLVGMGYDLFDVVLPTRDARHGRFYVPGGYWYVKKKKNLHENGPVDPTCTCYTCTNYTRRYLHHLWQIRDSLFIRLATIHNTHFYSKLMHDIRRAIKHNMYKEFQASFTWEKKTVE